MYYTKKSLRKLLNDNSITTTAKSIAELLLIALDNGVVTREDIIKPPKEQKKEEPKKPRGRPRKYPPKIVDPDKPKDPKYDRLRTISKNPVPVTITYTETGEVVSFTSQYKASKVTGKDDKFFARNNGKIIGGKLYQIGVLM